MGVYFALYGVEILLLLVLLVKLTARGKKAELSLVLITLLCVAQLLLQLPQYNNIYSHSVSSFDFWYYLAFFSYGLSAALSDFVLVICLRYLFRNAKLSVRFSRAGFIAIWIIAVADSAVFLTNVFTSLAYTGMLSSYSELKTGFLFFFHLPGKWMPVHLAFTIFLVMFIFISMLLKCSIKPFFYAGKYITVGIYFIVVCVAKVAEEFLSSVPAIYLISGILCGGIPFLLCYQAFFYRPIIMLGSIRNMVFENLGAPVVLFDDEKMLADFNLSASELFALERPLVGHLSLSDFLRRSVGNQLRERSLSTVEEVSVSGSSGSELIFNLNYKKLSDKGGKNYGTLLFFHDITELRKLYNSMEKTAMTDPVTGLSSRIFLQKKITEINLYRKFPYTAVVCSLNGLSLISEGFGEDAGKAAEMHVAELLRSQLRASDFAAYDSGSMVVLMPDTTHEQAVLVFKRISRILSQDRTFNFILSLEFGVASRPDPDSPMQQTVSQAHVAMVNVKLKSDEKVHESIIDSLRDALRLSSFETEQHSLRVQDIALKIAGQFNISAQEEEDLRKLSLFHDIGKMSVPAELLNKTSALTEDEKRIMQLHVISGYKIANVSKELQPIARGILCHHERWDGKGYPNGYSGTEIPFLSRIVSVADSFDVMTHDRPYQKARPVKDAVLEIKRERGAQFDPAIVNAFLNLDFVKEIMKN